MARNFRVHLLDMGDREYGDCLIVEIGDTTVLIDGGHPGDQRSRTGFRSLPQQMETILQRQAPFEFDLLVLTHCHNDHIGCLPELVKDDIVRAKWALVADADLGWGIDPHDGVDPFAAGDETLQMVLAGLREEPPLGLSDAELQEFLADGVRLSVRYRQMLDDLEAAGTKVVRCGKDNIRPLLNAFRGAGLKYLGPTEAHLAQCTAAIGDIGRDSRDSLSDEFAGDAPQNAVAMYRSLMESGADAADARGIGAAINNQSIVLVFEADGKRVLLTGDMQFAKPEVDGLDDDMRRLRRKIAALAPYEFVKIAHHASYNAFDESVLEELGSTNCFGISAGSGDIGHPARAVLNILKARRDDIRWVRTDRNGRITIDLSGAEPAIDCQRGSPNNTRLNSDAGAASVATVVESPQPEVSIVALPPEPMEPISPVPRTVVASTPATDFVQVITKVPHVATKVTVTIQVEPQTGESSQRREQEHHETQPDPAGWRLAGGRPLPKLLFATSRGKLTDNIGAATVAQVIAAISQAGHVLVHNLPSGNVAQAASLVRAALQQHPDVKGVVLLGGYDVVPPQKFDTIDPELRGRLHGSLADGDDFIVWRDAIYGDTDGDADQELPVSRIPDGHSKELVLAALSAVPPTSTRAFGIRNLRRPYAEAIWDKLSSAQLLVSEPTLTAHVQSSHVQHSGRLYFMLHGDDDDTTRFWGESAGGGYPEAFHISRVPAPAPAVLLTGCCWGALTSQQTARTHVSGQPITSHTPATSLALAFLKAGVQAFVGCTGSHYSPTVSPYGYFGGPLHDAFWQNVLPAPTGRGLSPAAALFEAKKTYIAGMPHGQTAAKAIAIEMKILHQFHCLGLGW